MLLRRSRSSHYYLIALLVAGLAVTLACRAGDMVESFRQIALSAEGQSRITPEQRDALTDSFQSTLESYTYLED